ncbi:hypothetical protein BN165_350031 [Clostridioides difficile E1]|nr:hypothetical protein BN163_360031 [Clostridioides difficile T5]CCK92886.1 hypothetical protein BN164_330019 [Clostridioides difficile T20]CCK96514.1 hypothetical protein BN165_350031 [Clostridioides difficile E1]CCL00541.1 hypothetical protein BN166_420019 [Clostridioides difficile E10]
MYETSVSICSIWLIMIKNIVLPLIKYKIQLISVCKKFYVIFRNTIVKT